QDLGVEAVVVVDRADFADQLHAIGAVVVQAADERRDVGGAGLGGEQGLGGREAQGDVGRDTLAGELAGGDQAVPGERQLDHDVLGGGGQLAALGQHARGGPGGHLGRDRPGDDVGDLGDDLQDRPAGLGDQRGVGGDAVHEAGLGQLAQQGDVGGVEEEL